MIILTMFAVLLFLLSINVPIAIGLAVTTIVAMVLKTGTSFLIDTAIVLFDGSMKFPLIAIPLFILAGSIMNTIKAAGDKPEKVVDETDLPKMIFFMRVLNLAAAGLLIAVSVRSFYDTKHTIIL